MRKGFGKLVFCLNLIMFLFSINLLSGCFIKKNNIPLGVWWWDKDLNAELYLDFAENNKITEIYYCDSRMDSQTSEFINMAKQRDISVYLLSGDKSWLIDDSGLINLINKYNDYQKNSNNRFTGIHLDIEPHQFEDFGVNREKYIIKLVELADRLNTNYPKIHFDYDIPFWLDDQITYKGTTKEAYKFIIDYADRVFVMSYRDTVEAIYDVGCDEIKYAESINKVAFLSVETKSEEGNHVSFMEEGKETMYNEIAKLRDLLPKEFGISIHQIKTWYDLKD